MSRSVSKLGASTNTPDQSFQPWCPNTPPKWIYLPLDITDLLLVFAKIEAAQEFGHLPNGLVFFAHQKDKYDFWQKMPSLRADSKDVFVGQIFDIFVRLVRCLKKD